MKGWLDMQRFSAMLIPSLLIADCLVTSNPCLDTGADRAGEFGEFERFHRKVQ